MKYKRLLKKWYLFVLWAVVAVFFWIWITGMITRPAEEEKIGVFVCSQSCDQPELVRNLQAARPEYVRELKFKWVSPADALFAVYFDAFAVYESDIIIMPENRLTEISFVDFYELDTSVAEELFGECEYYVTENGSAYGIKIDVEKSCGKQTEAVSHYLFFNKKSRHLGKLSGSPLSGAISLARVFI